ncbi:uncharacterized protein SPAPADRAFT_69123 [Spathaspora passalidarum NRRL Y-27907]|uniref:Maintenance of telomere capping protein 4 n=1 Tax=Spathaspora passalidarum (strain NRRL Y-27907 / 11-Y1) TaxID=619300 RepID=G3ADY0_SPAPN|nr:uncharacterized protein SPAPADRAFT_69123 [Spathaspora passalidarum NRRL Y-27907]EGW34703.1 hypothetical protein SPAPADRAFT_69123 [Spathaspora passalidarum NRRL Y-27907]
MSQPGATRLASGNSVASQLRLSRVTTPDSTLHRQPSKNSPKSKHDPEQEQQYNDVKPRKKHGAGFDLDITVEEASELTHLFLDTRNTLRADCNIIDPVTSDLPSSPQEMSPSKFSRSTIVRAEKVKTMIGMKYLYIQRIYEWNDAHGMNTEHPGIEGVYNPLQILRNRKIRAKYKEFPKPLSSKTIPLACIVFSKHNQGHHRKRTWRMVWAIELNEFVSDSRWRARHWHELEKPNGELWFPPEDHVPQPKSKRKKLRRLHDKLFDSVSDYEDKKSTHRRNESVVTAGSSDSELNMLKIHRSKSPKKKLRNKMKKFYERDSSSSAADIEEVSDHHEILNTQMFRRVVHSESSSDVAAPDDPKLASISPPIIKIEALPDESIQDVEFVPSKRSSSSPALIPSDLEEEEEEDVSTNSVPSEESPELMCTVDQREHAFSKIVSSVDYLYEVCVLRTNHLLVTYPNNLQVIQNKVDSITGKQTFDILRQMSSINDEHLPVYEELYHGFLDEIKSIIHMVNDNYSVKIDSLLSSSDRAISEINASLSLELRKVNERLDHLDESFSKKTIRPSDLKMNMKEGTNYKIMYFCLENLIVILLRLIWVLVNIFKGGVMVVGVVYKIIRLFI